MLKENFKINISTNGYHTKTCSISPSKFSKLESVFNVFPNVSELNWFRKNLVNALAEEGNANVGLNYLNCIVGSNTCKLFTDYEPEAVQEIPASVIFDFIDKCIEFHDKYNKGKIPSIIPDTKKDEWIIVPREYVKDNYFLNNSAD